MQLSKNFSLRELTRSQTAIRKGIKNEPDQGQLMNLVALTVKILQPCREKFGSISINSGLRVLELNRAIGSGDKSQHTKGQASDFEAYSVSNAQLADWIMLNLSFDQLILEYPGKDPRDGWVHCSYNRMENRKQVLTAIKEKGKTAYKKGLLPDG
jgi:zinc D-Ala-D-Ala carboxypeptidase